MVKPKSALNDNSIDLLVEIARVTGNPSTPQLVEAALRAYMRELRQQAEYAEQPDARPWTDAGTPPDDWRDVKAMLDDKTCVKAWYADDSGGWRIYPVVGKKNPMEYAGDLGVTVTAWREIDPAAPSTDLVGD